MAQQANRTHRTTTKGRVVASPPTEREERIAFVAPLFAYCADRCLGPLPLARRAAMRASAPEMTKMRLWRIKNGTAIIPDWFIAGMCREIDQPIETVMGREWARRHLSGPAVSRPAVSPSSLAVVQDARAS